MNQRLNAQLGDHADNVLKLVLSALADTKAKLDKGMSAKESMNTLCSHVWYFITSEGYGAYHKEIKEILRKTAKTWLHYSGDTTCPVPAPSDFSTGESKLLPQEKIYERVFHGHLYEGNFWDQTTEYGRMRVDLLNHNIKVISVELENRRSEV